MSQASTSLHGCTKRSVRNPGRSPGGINTVATVCKTVPRHQRRCNKVTRYCLPGSRIRTTSPRASPPVTTASLSIAFQAIPLTIYDNRDNNNDNKDNRDNRDNNNRNNSYVAEVISVVCVVCHFVTFISCARSSRCSRCLCCR